MDPQLDSGDARIGMDQPMMNSSFALKSRANNLERCYSDDMRLQLISDGTL